MSIIGAIILGLVQGLTEFIPVSSSGHLVLVSSLTGITSSFEFDVLLNIGTLLALLWYFRLKIIDIIKKLFTRGDNSLLIRLIYSTLPVVVIGGLFAASFEGSAFLNGKVSVSTMLIIVGILMLLVDKLKTKPGLTSEKMTVSQATGIGVAQALALIPGTSRSGATILAGRAYGLNYEEAAEYSFLLAMPAVAGAILKTLLEADTQTFIANNVGACVVGVVVAFVSGFLAIKFMLDYLRHNGLKPFGYYRIVLGILVLLTALK